MVDLLGQHNKEFEDKVEHITEYGTETIEQKEDQAETSGLKFVEERE